MTQTTTATALGQLRDAIEAEVIAKLAEKLAELHDGSDDESYRDGVTDAITTIQQP